MYKVESGVSKRSKHNQVPWGTMSTMHKSSRILTEFKVKTENKILLVCWTLLMREISSVIILPYQVSWSNQTRPVRNNKNSGNEVLSKLTKCLNFRLKWETKCWYVETCLLPNHFYHVRIILRLKVSRGNQTRSMRNNKSKRNIISEITKWPNFIEVMGTGNEFEHDFIS